MMSVVRRGLIAASLLLGAGQAAAADPPQPGDANNPATWFSSDDYPMDALQLGVEGTTAFTVDVDATGKVVFCRVTESSGSASLDETTCRLVKERGRFTPQRDKKGRPVAMQVSRKVTWRIPQASGGRPLSTLPQRVKLLLDIDEDGNIAKCQVLEFVYGKMPVPPSGRDWPCTQAYAAQEKDEGAYRVRDEQGKPTRVRLEVTNEMKVVPAVP